MVMYDSRSCTLASIGWLGSRYMADAGGVGRDDSVEASDVDEVRLRLKLKLFEDDPDTPVGLVPVERAPPVPEATAVVVAVTTLAIDEPVEAEGVEVGAVAAVEDGTTVGPCGHHGQL
jgi:hypothetical protein